jgi:hypothetical protein
MSEADAAAALTESAAIEVHALLVCREVQSNKTGGVTVRDVVDIVPVLGFPGDAGPLSFAAFCRAKRAGEVDVSFRVHPMADVATTLVSLPGRLRVAPGYEGRQNVIGAGFKTLKVQGGGWFGVEFRVGSKVLARTRFAIGAIAKAPAPGDTPLPTPP